MNNNSNGGTFAAFLESAHVLIAGTTGSGKSTFVENLLSEIDKSGAKYAIIDIKRVSLSRWEPGAIAYARTPKDAENVLRGASEYMERIYKSLEAEGAQEYAGKPVYIIIDELADLLTGNGIQATERIRRELLHLLRLGRAANIHVIAATQSPNRKTIPAEMVANFTHRVGLRCISQIESRQIIGAKGCEDLPKIGYCIVRDPDGLTRYAFGKA